jgi:hypothetical protein
MGKPGFLRRLFHDDRCKPVPMDAETWKRLGYRVTPDGLPITDGMYMRDGKICYTWSEKNQRAKNEAAAAQAEREARKAAIRERVAKQNDDAQLIHEITREAAPNAIPCTVFSSSVIGAGLRVVFVIPHMSGGGIVVTSLNAKPGPPAFYRKMWKAMSVASAEAANGGSASEVEAELSNIRTQYPRAFAALTRAYRARVAIWM